MDRVLPGDLYSFADQNKEKPELRVNGKKVEISPGKGYVVLTRQWKSGDKAELTLPMPVRKAAANKNVKDNLGKVSFIRGPITYCAESIDHKTDVLKISIPADAEFKAEYKKELLGGVTVLKGRGLGEGNTEALMTLVPYGLWNNRGAGKMNVWFNEKSPSVQ